HWHPFWNFPLPWKCLLFTKVKPVKSRAFPRKAHGFRPRRDCATGKLKCRHGMSFCSRRWPVISSQRLVTSASPRGSHLKSERLLTVVEFGGTLKWRNARRNGKNFLPALSWFRDGNLILTLNSELFISSQPASAGQKANATGNRIGGPGSDTFLKSVLEELRHRGYTMEGSKFATARPDQTSLPLHTLSGRSVVAKLYSGDRGEATFAAMQKLWRSSFGQAKKPPGLPQPIEYVP